MSSYNFDTILTIEARGNILLDVMTTHFSLSNQQVLNDISKSLKTLNRILEFKQIKYSELGRALVPSKDKNDIAFVFDWSLIESSFYGKDIMEKILPLFDRKSSHSVLCGDWIYAREHDSWLCQQMNKELQDKTDRYYGQCQYTYFVYINNLSDSMVKKFVDSLKHHPAYLGYLNLKFTSPIKAFLSTLLVKVFIKHKNIIIQGHEDDRNEYEDENLLFYDFKKFNYTVRSVPSWLYGLFLSYKIERPVLDKNDIDTRFSLNSISIDPFDFDDFFIELDERKLEYLKSYKEGSLKKADFHNLSLNEVETQIKQKIKNSYIYNLARSENGETIKFNIMLENKNISKSECSLEYIPSRQCLRVITFY